MVLVLNQGEIYREFSGETGKKRFIDQMPALVEAGYSPMSIAEIMKRRVEVADFRREIRNSWINNHFSSGDAIVYHPNGKEFLICLDSEELRDVNFASQFDLEHGALPLGRDKEEGLRKYDQLKLDRKNIPFKVKDLEGLPFHAYRREVKSNPIWLAVARDREVLEEYVDFVFDTHRNKNGRLKGMDIFLGGTSGNIPELRPLYISGFDSESYLFGRQGLDSPLGHLIGIRCGVDNLGVKCTKCGR